MVGPDGSVWAVSLFVPPTTIAEPSGSTTVAQACRGLFQALARSPGVGCRVVQSHQHAPSQGSGAGRIVVADRQDRAVTQDDRIEPGSLTRHRSDRAHAAEPSMLRLKRRRLLFGVWLRKHMRFLSVKPVGAWRNGRARALGVPGTDAV